MEGKLGQSPTVLFKYKKLILAEEKTASAGGCRSLLAAFFAPCAVLPMRQCGTGRFCCSGHDSKPFVKVMK